MKTLNTILALRQLAVAGTAGLLLSVSGIAWGGTIVNSPHDFSGETWNNTSEICVVCHTPHSADTTVTAAPLWNHEVTTQTYTLYDSPTFDGAGTITQPTASSVLCLSCHDGSVAIDSFGGRNGGIFLGLPDAVGLDGLDNDHPISFVYDAALATADGGLFDPTTTNVDTGSGGDTKSGFITDVMLIDNQLQCASCHDVHNTFVAGAPLLRVANDGSALCLTCHDK